MIRVNEKGWRIDKRVPVAVILTMFIQIAGILIWAAQLDARVGNMERQVIGETSLNEKFARLEERLENMKQDIVSLRHQIDRLTERLLKK
jgi:Tfp pilus assembly protein PilO